jgi:hypothetical protein
VLGVHGKLVKYVVYSSKRKNWKKLFFFTQAAQTAINQFLVSRNFRVKVEGPKTKQVPSPNSLENSNIEQLWALN